MWKDCVGFRMPKAMWRALLVLVLDILRCPVSSICPASPPCVCVNGVIDCSGHSFTNIAFIKYQRLENYHTLVYSFNQLTTILPQVFSNLNITKLLLDNNNISVIEEAAFLGIEGVLIEIDLSNNKLKHLPTSLGYLRKLYALDISGNLLDGERHGVRPRMATDDFTGAVMREHGDTLMSFTFGQSNTLSHWPESLHHLVLLERLYLTGSTFYYIKTGWFCGFENTIKTLSIKNSALVQVPVDIGKLSQLKELIIEYNRYDDGNSILIIDPFIGVGDTLITLSLRYNNITTFPNVIRYLNKLENLTLEGNSLTFITDEAVQILSNATLKYLSFRKCGLKVIPGSISDLKHLIELDLSINLIKTIESFDIVRMTSLQTLVLSNNPLYYVSRSALRGLYSLTFLDMSSCKFTVLPEAIQNLRKLRVLDLTDTPIDCTCSLYWIKRWMDIFKRNLTFYGDCETIHMSVDRYINYRIPSCPQFVRLIG